MTASQDWWPADYGHYGPLFIRMAWHSAGTYRIGDGRGGAGSGEQRFAPLNSWPDNANLDKARLLAVADQAEVRPQDLVGRSHDSWPETARWNRWDFKTFGFARRPRRRVGARREHLLGSGRHVARRQALHRRTRSRKAARGRADGSDLREPGRPERQSRSARRGDRYSRDVRPHGDERRGDRRADCRRTYVRQDARRRRSRASTSASRPPARGIEEQNLGWRNSFGSGNGDATITSGLEGAWTQTPTRWSNLYFDNLFNYEWELTKSPAGAYQWKPKDGAGAGTVPDAHDPSKKHAPTMLTTDLALKVDPIYGPISKRFHENPQEFADAFAKAWYKLTHRDMGPISRYLGPEVPAEPQIWQDPAAGGRPSADRRAGRRRAQEPHSRFADSRCRSWSRPRGRRHRRSAAPTSAAARTVRAFVSHRRRTGPSISRPSWRRCCKTLEKVQAEFNASLSGGKKVSLADVIVLGGCAAIEQAAKRRRSRREGRLRAGTHRCDAGEHRRRTRSRCWNRRPTDSATTSAAVTRVRPSSGSSIARNCSR